MSKLYIESIEWVINDALEMEFGIVDEEWGIGIDSDGDPYIEIHNGKDDILFSDDPDVPCEGVDLPDVAYSRYGMTDMEDMFNLLFKDQAKDEKPVTIPETTFNPKRDYTPLFNVGFVMEVQTDGSLKITEVK